MNLFFFVVLAGVFAIAIAEDDQDGLARGPVLPTSVLLLSEHIEKPYSILGTVSAELVYPKEGEPRQYNITNVVAVNRPDNGATVELLEGGQHDDHVHLKITSGWFKGFNYTVEIYGVPKAALLKMSIEDRNIGLKRKGI